MTTSASKPRPIVGGNWKMNTDKSSAVALARAVAQGVSQAGLHTRVDVAVIPPFPYLLPVAEALAAFPGAVMLGAQDCYIAEKGAFTGEVSVPMLKDCGVQAVLVGHSERRHVIHEGDDLIEAKVQAVLNAGLTCVLCVGEKLEQRETGQTNTINERQVRNGLKHVSADMLKRVVIAYEPVWAIGTGKTATPADAQSAQHAIRNVLADMFGPQPAAAVRIQYGGSMNAANAASLMAEADINGGLIGGASLKPEDFLAIIKAAAH